MRRAEAIEILAAEKGEGGLSVTTMRALPDWYEAGAAADLNLDNRGCMGAASALGLGLALAQPARRVLVVDGDGSLLMQLGSLATVAGSGAANFYHVVMVNGVYETSGQQAIPASEVIDFAALARGAGYRAAYEFEDAAVLRERLPGVLQEAGPVLIALRVEPEVEQKPQPENRPADPAGFLRAQLVP